MRNRRLRKQRLLLTLIKALVVCPFAKHKTHVTMRLYVIKWRQTAKYCHKLVTAITLQACSQRMWISSSTSHQFLSVCIHSETEQVCLCGNASERCPVRNGAEAPIISTEVAHVFPQPLQQNPGILSWIQATNSSFHFLSNLSFINHPTIRPFIIWATDSFHK
jgi:hypothetical protein